MDKKVYYGEYSLKHWIELLLKKDLELPANDYIFAANGHKTTILDADKTAVRDCCFLL